MPPEPADRDAFPAGRRRATEGTALRPRSSGTLRMILQAAARVLGCASAQIALVDGDALVLRLGVSNAEQPMLNDVELALGFSAEGASLPLSAETSVMVRAVREGRLLVTARFGDLAGNLVSDEVSEQIQALLGRLTYAAVPVLGRSGPIGVILFVKTGDSGFAPADRDLLVAYADRVGVAVEEEGIVDDGDVLEALGGGDLALPPPAVYLFDTSLRILEGELTGWSLPAVLRAERVNKVIAEAVSSCGREGRLLRVLTDDGHPLRVSLRRVAEGRFAAVVEEVGWMERLGREAARARDHLAKLLGSVTDGVFTVDAHGTIVGCNAAANKLVGLPPAELLGRPVDGLIADERSRRRARQLIRALAEAGHAEGELRLLRGGRAIDAYVSALLLADDEGRPAGALWRARDLSERRRGDAERKRLRERLLRSQRLSALGEMAARIAHDVRNPLVSIGAAARVVEEEMESGGFGGEVIGEVQAIQREVRRLDGIVSTFLHLARDQRPLSPPRELVDIGALVDETLSLLRAKAPAIELRLSIEGPCRARCDADGMRQVLWNVLTNAVEASPEGGAVDCELRNDGQRVVLSVADDGPGIAAALRRRAFDPFYSTKARGTGLGLAITRQIVEDHGGRIRLLGRRRGGTLVRIELPSS